MCASLVDETGCPARIAIYFINGPTRKDIPIRTGKREVSFHIVSDLGSIKMGQLALNVNALPDGSVCCS